VPHIAVPEGKADPEVRVWALRPEMGMGAGALSHAIYDESIVPVRERELARMRIAQINGCIICQQWRSTPGAEGAVTEDDYAHVLEWRAYDGYSERERIAIDYAERFALDHHSIDGDYYARMRAASFTDAEILDLTVCIGGWMALGRTLHVLGLDDACKIAP
jgi:alkylhydroperoxidase family enzyme